jgi:hypothetical protein
LLKLERFHKNVGEGPSLTTLVGYAAQDLQAGTSGQVTSLDCKINEDEMYGDWLYYYLIHNHFFETLKDKIKGTGSKRIHQDVFFKIEIPLPDKTEQKRIIDKIKLLEGNIIKLRIEIEKTKNLRVGFSNYIPAFMYDSNYGNFSGIFYDIITEIAKKYNWSIRWTEEVGYGVIIDGLNNNRFDIFGSTVWPTPERKQKADFSISLYKSETFIWVRADYRKNDDDIRNDKNARVAVKENDISDSIAKSDFPNNHKVRVPQLSDTTEILKFVDH